MSFCLGITHAKAAKYLLDRPILPLPDGCQITRAFLLPATQAGMGAGPGLLKAGSPSTFSLAPLSFSLSIYSGFHPCIWFCWPCSLVSSLSASIPSVPVPGDPTVWQACPNSVLGVQTVIPTHPSQSRVTWDLPTYGSDLRLNIGAPCKEGRERSPWALLVGMLHGRDSLWAGRKSPGGEKGGASLEPAAPFSSYC